MKLKRLIIDRLPGINQSFAIDAAGAGFHVVFGPNAIGKSSLCRAVEGLYWEDRGSSSRTSVTGEFELDGESWRAERDGSRVRWQRGGEASAAPNLPAPHNHRYFFLRLLDLIDPSADGTHDIASEIRRQMSGGFDLDQIAADLFAGIGARHGRRERSEFNSASHEVQKAEGEQGGL
ncbi:MAG: AAA family ATPase, partial [Verrucomicrobiia bacterium]